MDVTENALERAISEIDLADEKIKLLEQDFKFVDNIKVSTLETQNKQL